MTIDTVTFTVTAAAAGGSANVPVTGDTATIRSTPAEVSAQLVGFWSKIQAGGFSQLTFPYGHDNVRNIRIRSTINNPVNGIPLSAPQFMKSQDLMTLTTSGAATAGDMDLTSLLIAYPDLPGGSDKFIDASTLATRGEELVTIEDLVTPTVASVYSGARALNAVTTSLKANRDYAVLGVQCAVAAGTITVRGQDTGNLRVGLPANPLTQPETRDWFIRLSDWFGLPTIPVLNAANQAGTFIEVVQDENLAAVPFSLMLCLLEPS